jgi:acyl-CoA thioesterase-1
LRPCGGRSGDGCMIDRRVLFFGDSLVAGVGDPEGRGWVGRIVASSFEAGMPLTAYNLGVRRETSVEVAARFHAEAVPRLIPGAECSVVFSFGANDATIEAGRLRVDPERSLESLGAVLNRAGGLDLRALVVGPAPVDDAEQTDRIEALSRSSGRICAERSVPFVDTVGELRDSEVWCQEVAAGDGAHPSAPGYELLADLILRAGWHDWLQAA